jgi:hypothetical protein
MFSYQLAHFLAAKIHFHVQTFKLKSFNVTSLNVTKKVPLLIIQYPYLIFLVTLVTSVRSVGAVHKRIVRMQHGAECETALAFATFVGLDAAVLVEVIQIVGAVVVRCWTVLTFVRVPKEKNNNFHYDMFIIMQR